MMWVVTIAVVALILAGGIAAAVYTGRRQEQQARYLSVIAGNKTGLALEDGREKQLARQRADIARKLKEAGQEQGKKKGGGSSIREMMQQAGFAAPPSKFWTFSAVFAAGVCAVLNALTSWPQAAVIFATFTAFIGLPRLFLKMRAARRQKKFLEEFPDALDASVRLLQAGMPITEAIAMASREFTGPLKDEMTRIYENQKVGVTLGQAALETARRIPLTEVHMFATALQIQSETGSSLGEVLSNLSAVIRARFRLKRKVKALSSEAKASAAIIASRPLLVTLGLKLANPAYIALLYTTSTGKMLGGGAAMWMLLGIIIMRQMINFKV